jgi:probable phosphoglycerate mutase
MADTATPIDTAATDFDTSPDSVTAARKFPQSRFSPPPGATEILLVRHGESAPHVEGESFDLVDGHGDPPLAPGGWEQAKLAAQRLIDTGERIAAVYVTTLQRTHQTAEPLLEKLFEQFMADDDI